MCHATNALHCVQVTALQQELSSLGGALAEARAFGESHHEQARSLRAECAATREQLEGYSTGLEEAVGRLGWVVPSCVSVHVRVCIHLLICAYVCVFLGIGPGRKVASASICCVGMYVTLCLYVVWGIYV
jgi:hypothetical protein